MCEACLTRAREARLTIAWIYECGHILDNISPLPTLADFPTSHELLTLCGLPITGMGYSRLYKLEGEPLWTH